MSRFQQLMQLAREDEKERKRYQERCQDFLVEIHESLTDFLDCERGRLSWYAPAEDGSSAFDSTTTVGGAMELEADGYFAVGLALLVPVPDSHNKRSVGYRLRLKYVDETFHVQFGLKGPKISISESPSDARSEGVASVCESIYELAEKHFEEGFEKFIRQGREASSEQVGFHTDL